MFAGRSAILILALCLSLVPCVGSASSGGPAREDRVSAAHRFDPLLVRQVVFRFPESTSAAQFTPWIARQKVMMEDTDDKFGEEADLGPVLSPRVLTLRASVNSNTFRASTTTPLRC
jgi:hypothetical protein